MTHEPATERSRERTSVENVLGLHRDVVAGLLRSDAIAHGDVDAALPLITEAAARLLGVQRASVWRLDADRTRIDCLDLHDAHAGTHTRGMSLARGDAPTYFAATLEERVITAHDARTDPRTREFAATYLEPNGITAMLDAPVIVRGELIGVVCHEHVGSPRRWNALEELLAGTLADFVGMALSAAEHATQARELAALSGHLEERVAMRTRELAQSRENVRALFATSPVALVLTRISDQQVILANDRAAQMFEVPVELAPEQRAPDFWVEPGDRLRMLEAVRDHGGVDDLEVRLKTRSGRLFWGAVSATTLVFEGAPSLLVGVHDITRRKELEEQLRDLAIKDGLTGIANRRHFFDVARAALASADRHERTASVAMLDVDHFKSINDEHGHAAGDEVLRAIVRTCLREIRASDVLARYGGEELVLLLPETSLSDATAVVERILAAIRREPVETRDGAIAVTVSGGVAEWKRGESLDDLLRRADEALYAAKGAGRDRVASAFPPELK